MLRYLLCYMRTVFLKVKPNVLRTQAIAVDIVVYVTLFLLLWGTWTISEIGFFRAGDDLGYWLGFAGGMMILLLFSYPLRKHFRFARNWGRMKWWLVAHMFLGVGGPLLILLHSRFQIGSLNAGVALYSMLIVVGSGVVGRFIYMRVNRGLYGEKADFRDLQLRAGLDRDEACSRLAFAPNVEVLLKAFEQKEIHTDSSWGAHLRRVFLLPITQWITFRQCMLELRQPLRRLSEQSHFSPENYARREKHSRMLVRKYINAVVRVAQYSAYAKLFSLWHVVHIPFVYLLIISTVVHVVAVHMY